MQFYRLAKSSCVGPLRVIAQRPLYDPSAIIYLYARSVFRVAKTMASDVIDLLGTEAKKALSLLETQGCQDISRGTKTLLS